MTHVSAEHSLDKLQQDTFQYFLQESNPENGLIRDNTRPDAPCSIAAVGFGLTAYAVGVERGWIGRAEAARKVLATLRFFWKSPQNAEPDATGYRGFYYHFLDMTTGRRVWACELSTIDTAILIMGTLAAGAYFDADDEQEDEIRSLADALYRRVDWSWAQNKAATVTHGWKPESGFLNYRWEGYSEALILYILGLGSPTHPLPAESYPASTITYQWENLYGYDFLFAGPLFIHQLSHIWIDFREIQDEFMRAKGSDYFQSSRNATYVQQHYAVLNPREFAGYGRYCWGITASAGPGPAIHEVAGVKRRFFGYRARAVPYGPDDGTLSPWAAVASLPFAPEIAVPTIEHFDRNYPEMTSEYGFKCSFNPSFPNNDSLKGGWISGGYYGIDQGPVVLMIENYRSEFVWNLMKQCPYVVAGLRRAGFQRGWL